MKFLADKKLSPANDLQVYYHVLRSHYMEAFECHGHTILSKSIENQGLYGQDEALPRDKLIFGLKKLLPNVSRKLVDICRMDNSKVTTTGGLLANEKQSKMKATSWISSALTKAKQTFNNRESINSKSSMFSTELIPFLRTPQAKIAVKRPLLSIINPKIIVGGRQVVNKNKQIDYDDDGPSPSKRLKLSPPRFLSSSNNKRSSVIVNSSSNNISMISTSILNTPVVRRETQTSSSNDNDKSNIMARNITTPQSILKVCILLIIIIFLFIVLFVDNFRCVIL